MGTPVRTFLTTMTTLLAAASLHAESGTWSAQVGMALPSGGSKQWVGTSPGPSLDVMETYSLDKDDDIRMRFGYFAFKGSSDASQVLLLPGATGVLCPATTTNELFAFSYGAEYLRALPAGFYVLAGLGVTYVSATRSGTFDLTPAGSVAVKTDFGANNFVPYVCAGLGFRISRSVALEGRWQAASMKEQTRPLDLSTAGFTSSGHAEFSKLNVSAISVGINVRF